MFQEVCISFFFSSFADCDNYAAGGYDAVWLLVFEPKDIADSALLPASRVEAIWSSYTKLAVSPLAAVESVAKGARLENIESIKGLKDLL